MKTTPELLALQDLSSLLERAEIAYMLTGSLAMAYYARPRMTRDIDLVVALDETEISRLAHLLGDAYFADAEALAEAFAASRPCNVVHLATVVKFDLIPRKASEYRRIEFERRKRVNFAGMDLWIVSPEDLILSKLDWARDTRSEVQLGDVAQLLQAPVDRDYLRVWAARLAVEDLLRKASGE